jgi:RHS repeat-associated protein
VTYGYDPQGRRIKKLVTEGANRTETHYVLDTERAYHEIVIERTRTNNDPWQERAYLHTPGGVGELISDSDGTSTRQVYTDGQGSTRLTTDGTTTHSWSFDAFGNLQAGSSAPVTHLYTGERYDPDTGLIYLRARDYDPKTGRFISMDEHPGSQRIPLTLNKYLYGNADPVNHVDPSGYFTMGGVMSGIGGLASISIRAIGFYSKFIDPFVENFDSEVPTLWDAVMQVTLGRGLALAASMESTTSSFHQMSLPLGGRTEEHHTIPVYLCGARPKSVQPLATIDKGLHDSIHRNMDAMTATINAAGKTVDLLFKRGKAPAMRPTTMRLARTKGGRGTIVSALSAFYTFNDLWSAGGDKPGTRSIGEAFGIYSPQFVSDRKKTSIYQRCSR